MMTRLLLLFLVPAAAFVPSTVAPRALVGRRVALPSAAAAPARVAPLRMMADENEQDGAMDKVKELTAEIKKWGLAGGISYGAFELLFWVVSVPIACLAFIAGNGHVPDMSNVEDAGKVSAWSLGFITLARFAVPFRIGIALALAPWVDENVCQRFGIGGRADDVQLATAQPAPATARRSAPAAPMAAASPQGRAAPPAAATDYLSSVAPAVASDDGSIIQREQRLSQTSAVPTGDYLSSAPDQWRTSNVKEEADPGTSAFLRRGLFAEDKLGPGDRGDELDSQIAREYLSSAPNKEWRASKGKDTANPGMSEFLRRGLFAANKLGPGDRGDESESQAAGDYLSSTPVPERRVSDADAQKLNRVEETLRRYEGQLTQLEVAKRQAIGMEDYDRAKLIAEEMDYIDSLRPQLQQQIEVLR